jgi:hypothetical protein
MKNTLKALFVTVEVNLILWLAASGMALDPSTEAADLKIVVIVGVVFAAVVQHWAYYAVYKRAKQL